MRVLFLVSEYPHFNRPLDGIFFEDQARQLVRSGVRVEVVFVEPRSLRDLSFRALQESHFQVVAEEEAGVFTMRRRGWNPWVRSRVGRMVFCRMTETLVETYLRRYGTPDLVHAQGTIWAGHIARRIHDRFDVPYVITEYSSSFLTRRLPPGAEPSICEAFQAAERLIAVSKRLADAMRPFASGREIIIVPNMVDLDRFPLAPAKAADPFVFLAVAHLNPNKGFDLLVRAFAGAFRGAPDVRLEIGGDGPERPRLEAMARAAGVEDQIRFLGYLQREKVRTAIHGAHALVHPSHNETFGVILIEAMAAGIPVVATRCGGPEEIVTDEVGLLVDPGDVEQLSGALRAVRLASAFQPARIRQYVAEHFGADRIGRTLAAIYADVVSGDACSRRDTSSIC